MVRFFFRYFCAKKKLVDGTVGNFQVKFFFVIAQTTLDECIKQKAAPVMHHIEYHI